MTFFPVVFHGYRIRTVRMYGTETVCAYDLGRALGYSEPGNLSRNLRHVKEWREALEEDLDYFVEQHGSRGRIWLTHRGVRNVLRLVITLDRVPERAKLADEMLVRWGVNERHRIASVG